jgi:hypothetical protein
VDLLVVLGYGLNIAVPTLLLSVQRPNSAHFVAAKSADAAAVLRSNCVVLTAFLYKLWVQL